jgi:acyl-coenzyme A thioesterase PaaI-like protein
MTATEPDEPHRPHVLSDLDVTTEQISPDRSISVAPLVDAVRNCAGAAALGYLAALVDVNCALVALIAAAPEWTATADLALHGVDPLTIGPSVVESQLVRAGRNVISVSVTVTDGGGVDPLAQHASIAAPTRASVVAARGLVTFARIPREASAASASFDPLSVVGTRRSLSPAGAAPTARLPDRVGLRTLDAPCGVVELAITDYVRNSFGTINGGVIAMLAQASAEAVVEDLAATDLQVHYLAQARQGPARTVATLLRRGADHAVCLVEVLDAGDGDARLAQASVTLAQGCTEPRGGP